MDTSHLTEANIASLKIDSVFCSEKIQRILWGDYNPRIEEGTLPTLPTYTDLGGYPLYYVDKDNSCLCPDCANKTLQDSREEVNRANGTEDEEDTPLILDQDCIEDSDINYEDSDLYCDECSERIPSAYAED